MSVTLSLEQTFKATMADGSKLDIGTLYTPNTVTLTTGVKYETSATVADNYTAVTLWATGDGGMDKFEVALIYSDANIWINLKTDIAGDEFALIHLQGGVWHLLTQDDVGGYATTTRLDGAVLVEDTDYAQVDAIVAHNNVADDAGDAVVHLILLA